MNCQNQKGLLMLVVAAVLALPAFNVGSGFLTVGPTNSGSVSNNAIQQSTAAQVQYVETVGQPVFPLANIDCNGCCSGCGGTAAGQNQVLFLESMVVLVDRGSTNRHGMRMSG